MTARDEAAPEDAVLPWPKRALALSATGRALLEGELDWMSLRPRPRWIGGLLIEAPDPAWRWSEAEQRPIFGLVQDRGS